MNTEWSSLGTNLAMVVLTRRVCDDYGVCSGTPEDRLKDCVGKKTGQSGLDAPTISLPKRPSNSKIFLRPT